MLERDRCILLGALGGLGTGDLFPLISPAESQASRLLSALCIPISPPEFINNYLHFVISPHICRFLLASTWTEMPQRSEGHVLEAKILHGSIILISYLISSPSL